MAYGDVVSTNSQEDSAVTAHDVAIVGGNNDFAIMTFSIVNNTGDIATTPAGWTLENRHVANNKNMYVFTRRLDGGEGTMVRIITSTAVVTAHTCLAVEAAKKNNRSADGEDSGSSTMTAGSFSPGEAEIDPYLVVVTYTSWAGASPGTITSWPSSFDQGRTQTNQTGQGVSICATGVVNNDSIAKSHTKSTSLAWVAGALSLIEDTSDPPAAPAPKAKSLLYPARRCNPATFVKNGACTGLLSWCAPERDGNITLSRTGETDHTLTTDSGSQTLNGEDLDLSMEICGSEITQALSITNCTYEGYDFSIDVDEGTYLANLVINPTGCSTPSTMTRDNYISHNSGGTGPGIIDYSFDYNAACSGAYNGGSPISIYLGNWRNRVVLRNAADTVTYADCYEDADWYLKNDDGSVGGWYLRTENEVSSGQVDYCMTGGPVYTCVEQADRDLAISQGLFWARSETPRSCPTEIVPT